MESVFDIAVVINLVGAFWMTIFAVTENERTVLTMADCLHCDKYGDCRLRSGWDATVPCTGACEDYVEVDEDECD